MFASDDYLLIIEVYGDFVKSLLRKIFKIHKTQISKRHIAIVQVYRGSVKLDFFDQKFAEIFFATFWYLKVNFEITY